MKLFENFTELEKSVLLVWGNELNYSTKSHFPKNKINKRIDANVPGIRPKDRKKINKMLLNSSFICKKPTGRNTTYCLTPHGLKCCNNIKRDIGI